MSNKDLKAKYDEMHKQGASAWYGDGREERETILKMGEPWEALRVLEIGCGEGDLVRMIDNRGGWAFGIDYCEEAIKKAKSKYGDFLGFHVADYKSRQGKNDRLVMQGVLEHLDDPFTELKWMMDNLLAEHGDVITSSPCFLNPRGIVWMTLDMLGAVMSKTDLHFLHPWEFGDFCYENGYKLTFTHCDTNWANGFSMVEDLKQRIPLALRDGNIPFNQEKLDNFLKWLHDEAGQTVWNCNKGKHTPNGELHASYVALMGFGATMVYRITK